MTQNELQLNKKLRDSFKKDKETGEALGWIGGVTTMELWNYGLSCNTTVVKTCTCWHINKPHLAASQTYRTQTGIHTGVDT